MIPTNPTRTATIDEVREREFSDPDLHRRLRSHCLILLNRKLGNQPLTRRHEEAEEIVQIVMQRAWQCRKHFDSERGSLAAWLHGFLVRVVAEQCRAIRKHPVALTEPLPDKHRHDDGPDHPDPLAMLEHLSREDRVAVEGFYLLNLSHRQIADRLGITEGAARVRLLRALNKLRRRAGEVRP